MDYSKVLKARVNRRTREGHPFVNFYESVTQCTSAGNAVLENQVSSDFSLLLERSVVISAVTAIEVYYRDVLDGIFRYCSPDFFEPKLKQLHADKYDISDLLDMYDNKIHPLELVSNSQSFQNIEKIERVFSKFTGKGFWSSVLQLQFRGKKSPNEIATWSNDDFEGLRATFNLRHELVHDPARKRFLTAQVVSNIGKSAHMIFGSDVVLMEMMHLNRDPSLESKDTA
jgi:hypothetical protein